MTNEKNPVASLSDAIVAAVEQAQSATLLVNARRRLPASGIVYKPNLILTADHVVERDEEISVVLPDGDEFPAEVAGRDPGSDLALLRLAEECAAPIEAATIEPRVGQLVIALGRPSTAGIEASLGVVSAVNGPVRTRRGSTIERYIRTDAIPLPGFSGGPLVDVNGQVLGINTSGMAHGMLLSIPVDIAWKTAQALAEHGSIKRGFLGVRSEIVEIPDAAREALGRKQSSGLLLTQIEAESPAAASDLMVGDIIVGNAGFPVPNHDALHSRLMGDVVGQQTPIEVIRGGKLQVVDVTIGERPVQQGRGKERRRKKRRGFFHHHHRR
jgi:S1-C subfamily serine protease